MTLHLDTSALIDALTGPRRSLHALAALVSDGHRLAVSSIVMYEWLRGPRTKPELVAQQALLPREAALPFTVDDAHRAAALYRRVPRARGREIDLAIAACAIGQSAALWTLNPEDFQDVPDLNLV